MPYLGHLPDVFCGRAFAQPSSHVVYQQWYKEQLAATADATERTKPNQNEHVSSSTAQRARGAIAALSK